MGLVAPAAIAFGVTRNAVHRRLAWLLLGIVFAVLWGALASGATAAPQSPTEFNLAQAAQREGVICSRFRKPDCRHQNLRMRRMRMSVSIPSSEGGKADMPVTDVVHEAMRWLGAGNFTGKPGAWCAWAVSAWLSATGHRPLASGMASSALTYGPRLSAPRVGALAVLSTRRGWAAHVGVVSAVYGNLVETINGNWSHRVSKAVLPAWRYAAFIGV